MLTAQTMINMQYIMQFLDTLPWLQESYRMSLPTSKITTLWLKGL